MQDDIKINPENKPETQEPSVESKHEQIETDKEFFIEKQIEKKDDKSVKDNIQDDDDDELKAKKEADRLRDDKYEGRKIDQLLLLAKEKGADFAINVARKTNDPTLLDLLHDKIIEEELHKKT